MSKLIKMNHPEAVIDGYPFKYYAVLNKTGNGNSYRNLTSYLVKRFRACYFCARPVKQYPTIDGIGSRDDQATIEHLAPRGIRKKYEIVEKVLACSACNAARNDMHQSGKAVYASNARGGAK